MTPVNPQMRRQARLWLALVFLLGGAIGSAFGYAFAHRSYAATLPAQLSEPERRAKKVSEMTREIGLSPEQSKQLDAMLLGAHQEMKNLHDKSESDIEAVRQNARNEMRAILTAEQKPKFEAFVQKIDAERKNQMAQQH